MKVKNPKFSKTMQLDSGGVLEIEINDELLEKIKEEYGISQVDDFHAQVFFRDILKDAAHNQISEVAESREKQR